MWENDRECSAGMDLCYTTDLFTARAKKWIADQTAAHPGQPFFAYLAFDTPHAKLQNPPCAYPLRLYYRHVGSANPRLELTCKPGHL